MSVHQNSRYRFKSTIQVEDSSGNKYLIHKIRKTTYTPVAGSRVYTTKAGDTFEKLAQVFYNDPRKWYVIADSNPSIIFPLDLEVGVEIVIPPRTYAVLS